MIGDELHMIMLGCPCPLLIIVGGGYLLWRAVRAGDRVVGKGRRKGGTR